MASIKSSRENAHVLRVGAMVTISDERLGDCRFLWVLGCSVALYQVYYICLCMHAVVFHATLYYLLLYVSLALCARRFFY